MNRWGRYCGQHLSEVEMDREGGGAQKPPTHLCPASPKPACPRGVWERNTDAVGVSQVTWERWAWAQTWTSLAGFASYFHSTVLPSILWVADATEQTRERCHSEASSILSPACLSSCAFTSFAGKSILKEGRELTGSVVSISKFWQWTHIKKKNLCLTTMHVCGFVCVYTYVYIYLRAGGPIDVYVSVCVCIFKYMIQKFYQTSLTLILWWLLICSLFLKILFIYLFLFMAVLRLRFCARAFSSGRKWGPLFIVVRGPLTIAASLVVEHRLQTRRLSNCGSRA